MRHWLILAILILGTVMAVSAPQPGASSDSGSIPSYVCAEADGTRYQIAIGTEGNHLRIIPPPGAGHRVRDIALAGANLLRPASGPGDSLIYDGWNPNGKSADSLLDFSVEFEIRFVTEKGATTALVSLTIDNREPATLDCHATGFATAITMASSLVPDSRRYAERIAKMATWRSPDGTLTPIAVSGIGVILRRWERSGGFARSSDRKDFAERIAPALRKIDPRSISQIESRLSATIVPYWKSVLASTRYAYAPETERFMTWIEEGIKANGSGDPGSVAAGLQGFVDSPSYRDRDLKAIFEARALPALGRLNEIEATRVKLALKNSSREYFWALWCKAVGRRTLADSPRIRELAGDLGALVTSRTFDPQPIQELLSSFLGSPLGADPQNRQLFVQAASRWARQLSPRQREDVMGWLERDSDKQLFEELLR